MKTKITNFIALSLILICSLALSMNIKAKFRTQQACFNPETGVFRFDNNWKLTNGGGEITFQGKGRDVYIQVNNQNNSSSHQYFIIINGWDNTRSKVQRGDGSEVCFPNVQALDLNKQYNYRVVLDPATASITVFIDGNQNFSCTDPKGWNASGASWYSISKCGCADFQFCNLQTKPISSCFIPDPSSYKFQDDWTLGSNGAAEITFKGKGRDVYIQLNNQKNSSSHQYWLVINGWDNTRSRVTRGDGSEVCFPFVTAVDLNRQYDYRVIINPNTQTFTVMIDGQQSFSCNDARGWNAPSAQFYSVSRYSGANFEFCGVKSNPLQDNGDCWVPDPSSFKFNNDWKLNNGAAQINFKGKGRDVYFQLNNQNNSSSHQYWIVINGWDNTKSRITRGDGSEVCFPAVAALDLNKEYDFSIISNPNTQTISVNIDGKESFSCTDYNGWNAPSAQYFSISRYSGANFQICKLKAGPVQGNSDMCFIPNPASFKFQDDWKLNNGAGEITFKGKGRDVYFQLTNQNNNSSHQYWIVINGWDNTRSRITRGDGSEVCFPFVTALDLNVYHNFKITLSPNTQTITVNIDGKDSFSCTDSNGWNAPAAQFYGISRYSGANFQICNLKTGPLTNNSDICWTPNPASFKFQDDWKLNNGAGEIAFKARGRDVYIQLNNQNNSSSHQYWIVINGWDNTRSRVTRGDGSEVCFPFVTAVDLNIYHDFKIQIDSSKKSFTVMIDGQQSFTCTEPNGWNAPAAQYFSISRYSGANFHICNLRSTATNGNCWTPDPNAYKFQNDWSLNNGGAEINFKGKGRDVYIQLNNSNNSGSHQYWLVINGWDNTKSRVTRGDGSEVCFQNVTALDLNKQNDFKVIINPSTSNIKVIINGQESFSCTDSRGWNAPAAKYYSISKWCCVDFQICDVMTRPLALPPSYNLHGKLLNATTGQAISPLNGGIVTITDNATKVVYNGQINVADSSYSANVPAGDYTINGVVTSFISATTSAKVSGDTVTDIILVPSSTDNKTRVVLKWVLAAPRPVDLDLYVVNLNNTSERVYYLAKRSPSGQIVLDVDNVQSGPETVTIRQDATDNFQIAVKNYNKAIPLTQSGAVIDIYRGNNLVKSIPVPSTPGDNAAGWDVAIYNSKDGTLTANNKLVA
jgi:hypothetical protein